MDSEKPTELVSITDTDNDEVCEGQKEETSTASIVAQTNNTYDCPSQKSTEQDDIIKNGNIKFSDGCGPFSALTPSMLPEKAVLTLSSSPTQPSQQSTSAFVLSDTDAKNAEETQIKDNDSDFLYDEFGFRVDGEDSDSAAIINIPFIENKKQKHEWLGYLKLTQSQSECEAAWDSVDIILSRTEKLRYMVRDGIPHSLRSQVWMRLSGGLQKKLRSELSYEEIIKNSNNVSLSTSKQIEKDLLRILPTNACFSSQSGTGVQRLRRILRGVAWLYPDIGYCQGTGVIVASLLLFLEEEDAFWIMCASVEDLLPASYYSSNLIGIQADQRVLQTLISNYLPKVDEILRNHDIELSLITLPWFLTIFANVVHPKILLRIWDLLFCDGSVVLFQVALGMLKLNEDDFQKLENSAQIFNSLSDIPRKITNVNLFFDKILEAGGSLSQTVIDTHRRRHLSYLMADNGSGITSNREVISNLPKQQLTKRRITKNKSMLETLLFGVEGIDMKSKNVRQTEILVDLREAILKIARHFIAIEPKLQEHIQLVADYSMESHARDHENYVNVSTVKKRRAKALHDFERHDDDELGFRKNDIITIISQKDEHCWVGELNGLRGWFPAKFVELLDERSKQYTLAGDDAISETVTDLVRGTLSPTIKQVLEHGMKRPTFLGGTCHPWLFIEEAATREVEKDFESVYSRLILCKTYRLDEDGKVLTPEELLYRCVQAVNQTHDNVHAQMDVKLRSLICLGLNEQVLHLWLEVICSSVEIVQKWYHSWSFINSPGWVQIKCDLRILSQFAFNLNPDWELPYQEKNESRPLKDGVKDMLVKHHLFSWDL